MNKHFEDARYYLDRAVEHAKKGVQSELDQIQGRFKELTGEEEEPEPSRLDKIREDLEELEERAEGETRKAIKDARERIAAYRQEE